MNMQRWGSDPRFVPLSSHQVLQLSLGKTDGQMKPADMSQLVCANPGPLMALQTHLCFHFLVSSDASCLGVTVRSSRDLFVNWVTSKFFK